MPATVLFGDEIHARDEPSVLRGFRNPEILARAQATRRARRDEPDAPAMDENGAIEIEPGEQPSEQTRAAVEGKPKRGRPRKADRNLQGMEQMLLAMHMMIATATGASEMMLSPPEGHMLAEALATLSDHYKIKLDGKAGAVLGLIYAAGAVYGPRAVAIAIRVRKQKRDVHPSA